MFKDIYRNTKKIPETNKENFTQSRIRSKLTKYSKKEENRIHDVGEKLIFCVYRNDRCLNILKVMIITFYMFMDVKEILST
jgi:hypothetical protein